MKGELLAKLLGCKDSSKREVRKILKDTNIDYVIVHNLIINNNFPSGKILNQLLKFTNTSLLMMKLKCGFIDSQVLEIISSNAEHISDKYFSTRKNLIDNSVVVEEQFSTNLGKLYQGDCLELLKKMDDESVDLVFADPPFNLGKLYPSKMDDNISENKYIKWSQEWLFECTRILKPGGSLFVWNIPKWNTVYSAYLNQLLTFRHWIATDIKYSLPISGRLYPSHYSLLYYCKGPKPKVFSPDRLMMETCKSCFKEQKDYGGYKSKMNPKGINMTDVWYDIPPVRHNKFKGRKGSNELSLKLLDRIIEISTIPGDVVFDPFGGAGTTYIAAEIKNRKWIGIELGPVNDIINRFDKLDEETELIEKYRSNYNSLFPDKIKRERKKRHIWTDDTFKTKKVKEIGLFKK